MISKSIEETQGMAAKISEKIKDGGLVCLFGDIGSGKTTFTKGIAEAFGMDKFSIKSPTYIYIRKYSKNEKNIYHIDLYRLEEIDNLLWHEIEELLENKKNIIIIEWADRINEELPKNRIDIYFEYLDENSREIKISY